VQEYFSQPIPWYIIKWYLSQYTISMKGGTTDTVPTPVFSKYSYFTPFLRLIVQEVLVKWPMHVEHSMNWFKISYLFSFENSKESCLAVFTAEYWKKFQIAGVIFNNARPPPSPHLCTHKILTPFIWWNILHCIIT